MSVWAIADLHLSFGVPDKKMDIFGEKWVKHEDKIATHWLERISEQDLILLPGDISWAKHTQDAMADLNWIDTLPGTKVMIRGNHDYWWTSVTKLRKIMPPSIHLIQHDIFEWGDYIIGGARLWDTPEFSFDQYVPMNENSVEKYEKEISEESEQIFIRELGRLEMSLSMMGNSNKTRIAMTHYPPIGPELKPSRASAILEKYHIHTCVFGHIHNVDPSISLFGRNDGVRYILTAADYVQFVPVKLF